MRRSRGGKEKGEADGDGYMRWRGAGIVIYLFDCLFVRQL